jgi:hypothetical protein
MAVQLAASQEGLSFISKSYITVFNTGKFYAITDEIIMNQFQFNV